MHVLICIFVILIHPVLGIADFRAQRRSPNDEISSVLGICFGSSYGTPCKKYAELYLQDVKSEDDDSPIRNTYELLYGWGLL